MIELWLKAWKTNPEQLPIRLQSDLLDEDALARAVGQHLSQCGKRVATAESCTAGGIASTLTQVPGSSAWVEGGVVAYSNAVKERLLGVPDTLIKTEGAVSQGVVEAMARGVQTRLQVDLSVAVSGIAGPGGGSVDKPVGTVWFAWAGLTADEPMKTLKLVFSGDRGAVRHQALLVALLGLLAAR